MITAAAQEERFTRKKHDPGFPTNAIQYCLEEGGISLSDVDLVVFYDKPFLKFERLLETYLTFAPRGFTSFRKALPIWIREKLFQKDLLCKELGRMAPGVDGRIGCCSPSITKAMPPAPSIPRRSRKRRC